MIKRPMLSAKATEEELRGLFSGGRSYLLSPKIDGIRALVVNGQLVSRTMKPIRNRHTQALFGRAKFEGLDGELIVGNPYDKNLMQQTSSGVMSYEGIPDVRYCVFDKWDEPLPFAKRLDKAINLAGLDISHIIGVSHYWVSSYEELLQQEEHFLSIGYEGVMLRLPNGPYKQNRSTLRESYLVKVKRFDDAEAIITGSDPLYRNFNEAALDERGYTKRSHSQDGKVADDLLGRLHVRDMVTGVDFSIGSGFTESQRISLWEQRERLVGRIVKYKSFKTTGVKDAPRHPIFLGFRDLEDM